MSSPAADRPPDTARYQVDFVAERSRLTTFFRFLLIIPHAVLVTLYGIVAYVAVFFAWFAVVITGRYPSGLYGFVAGFIRYWTRVTSYYNLVCDPYPPFDGGEHPEYPVRLELGPPKEQYSRALAFFRLILMIPVMIILYAMNLLAGIGSFLAWFVIIVMGRMPAGLQTMVQLGVSYNSRALPYWFLLTERFPSFGGDVAPDVDSGRTPATV